MAPKPLNPEILDAVIYTEMCDQIEKMVNQGQKKYPKYTNHSNPIPTKIIPITKGKDFCFLSQEKDRVVVCLQGSVSKGCNRKTLKRWINNAKARALRNPNYHDGMHDAAEQFKADILNHITAHRSELGKDVPVHVVGLSRGGGMGVFAAIYLADQLHEYIKMTGFGIPRVLGRSWREKFNKLNIHCTNVQNNRDWICAAGAPVFKTVGYVKTLPVPVSWRGLISGPVARHTRYVENVKRLS